jgi:hypothetical protein
MSLYAVFTPQVIAILTIVVVIIVSAGFTLVLSKYTKVYHIYVGLIIGIIATLLWVNIPNIGGIIAAGFVYALMIAYLIIMLNPKSRISIWLNRLSIKINLKTLNLTLKFKSWNPSILVVGIILVVGGIFHFLLFWIFYTVLQFYVLGCIIALIGVSLLLFGLILQYKRIDTKDKLRSFLLLTSFSLYFVWQYFFYVYKMFSSP